MYLSQGLKGIAILILLNIHGAYTTKLRTMWNVGFVQLETSLELKNGTNPLIHTWVMVFVTVSLMVLRSGSIYPIVMGKPMQDMRKVIFTMNLFALCFSHAQHQLLMIFDNSLINPQ